MKKLYYSLFIFIVALCIRVAPVSASSVKILPLDISPSGIITIATTTVGEYNAYAKKSGVFGSGSSISSGSAGGIYTEIPNSIFIGWGSLNFEASFGYLGDNSYYFTYCKAGVNCSTGDNNSTFYLEATRLNGIWSGDLEPTSCYTGLTRICSVLPLNNSTTTATTTFDVEIYLNPDDVSLFSTWYIDSFYQTQPLGSEIDVFNEDLVGDGNITFSTSTVLQDGAYQFDVLLKKRILGFLGTPWSQDTENVLFNVGSSTYWGSAWQSGINDIMDSSSASSTATLLSACDLSGFNLVDCLLSVFWPPTEIFDQKLHEIKELVDTSWPLGYISQTVGVFIETATATVPVISATIPNGIAGAGSSIYLSLDSLSWLLNSTSTMTASSTETLGHMVSFYWDLIIYFALGLYVFRRLLGSHIIGDLSDTQKQYGVDVYKSYLNKK